MEYVLKTVNLVKSYKKQRVLNGVSINVCRGDVYGFVGENGSGKTTVIRAVTGLIKTESGHVELFGVKDSDSEILQKRRKIGAIVENPSIYLNLNAKENLQMQCGLLGIKDDGRILQTLEEVGLSDLYNSNKKAGNFSLGMRQRLGIAMALISEPEFIILDEPMNGLDPAGIVEVRELIIKLNKERRITFLISSHVLTELSLVATKYGIISKGKIIEEITAEQLQLKLCKSCRIDSLNDSLLYEILTEKYKDNHIEKVDGGVILYGEINLNELFCYIDTKGAKISSVNCNKTSIEDYYLKIMGERENA